jgi:hypothetical protein
VTLPSTFWLDFGIVVAAVAFAFALAWLAGTVHGWWVTRDLDRRVLARLRDRVSGGSLTWVGKRR